MGWPLINHNSKIGMHCYPVTYQGGKAHRDENNFDIDVKKRKMDLSKAKFWDIEPIMSVCFVFVRPYVVEQL